jgi:hypothetical protein
MQPDEETAEGAGKRQQRFGRCTLCLIAVVICTAAAFALVPLLASLFGKRAPLDPSTIQTTTARKLLGASHPGSKPDESLIKLCKASLIVYHAALTGWFTGSTPKSEKDAVLRALSLSPRVRLTTPGGQAFDRSGILSVLDATHGRDDPRNSHRPDLFSVQVIREDTAMIELMFREIVNKYQDDGQGGFRFSMSCVSTRAICEANPASESKVAWRSFVESDSECPVI